MKTISFAAVLMLFYAEAHAAATGDHAMRSSVIPPDVATSTRYFSQWVTAADGNTVVCPNVDWYSRGGVCKDEKGTNRWTPVPLAIPPGKTYAGFSIDTHYDRLYIYWR